MDNLIAELSYGNIAQWSKWVSSHRKQRYYLKPMHENEEKLEVSLNDQEALFHAIQDDHLDTAVEEKHLREAFTLGARLMAEILMGSYQKMCVDPSKICGRILNKTGIRISRNRKASRSGIKCASVQHGLPD